MEPVVFCLYTAIVPLVTVVVEQLIDEINVRQQHPSAAVPFESKDVQRLPTISRLLPHVRVLLDQLCELLPLMCDDLAT